MLVIRKPLYLSSAGYEQQVRIVLTLLCIIEPADDVARGSRATHSHCSPDVRGRRVPSSADDVRASSSANDGTRRPRTDILTYQGPPPIHTVASVRLMSANDECLLPRAHFVRRYHLPCPCAALTADGVCRRPQPVQSISNI